MFSNSDLFLRSRNNITQGNCNFLSTKCLINVNQSSWSTDCAVENSRPWLMLQDICISLYVHETISFCRMVNFHFPMVENSISWYFFSQSPKCWFILFQYTNVHLLAKFGDLKPTFDSKLCSQIQTCFWGAETTLHRETAIFFQPNV